MSIVLDMVVAIVVHILVRVMVLEQLLTSNRMAHKILRGVRIQEAIARLPDCIVLFFGQIQHVNQNLVSGALATGGVSTGYFPKPPCAKTRAQLTSSRQFRRELAEPDYR